MNFKKRTLGDDFRQLSVDAQALVSDTADLTTETVGESRKRLAATLEQGKEIYRQISDDVYDRALEADVVATTYLPHALCAGVGALLGYFAAVAFSGKRS